MCEVFTFNLCKSMYFSLLNDDVLLQIILWLEPKDVTKLPAFFVIELCQRHPHFIMPCKTYIADEIIHWFEINHLPLDLMVEKIIDDDGDEHYLKNGKHHRDNDLPALIAMKGQYCIWFKNGKKHRDHDLPAIIDHINGTQTWYQYDKLYHFVTNRDQFASWTDPTVI